MVWSFPACRRQQGRPAVSQILRICEILTSFGYAVPVGAAKPGDVVVLRNGRGYHVGILKSMSGKTAQILGGNQSGRVQVSNFNRKTIVSVRR